MTNYHHRLTKKEEVGAYYKSASEHALLRQKTKTNFTDFPGLSRLQESARHGEAERLQRNRAYMNELLMRVNSSSTALIRRIYNIYIVVFQTKDNQ